MHVREHGAAALPQVVEVVQRDRDDRAAARVVALAQHRDACREPELRGPGCDAVVRSANRLGPGAGIGLVLVVFHRRHGSESVADDRARYPATDKPPVTLWEERAARNEALFREVNEEIRDLDARS